MHSITQSRWREQGRPHLHCRRSTCPEGIIALLLMVEEDADATIW